MKLFAVVILSTLALVVQGEGDEFHNMVETCQTESKASETDVEKVFEGDLSETMEGKCFRACLMKKLKLIGENGKMMTESAKQLAQEHLKDDDEKISIANEIIDICKDAGVSENRCESAEEIHICFKNEHEKRGINPEYL